MKEKEQLYPKLIDTGIVFVSIDILKNYQTLMFRPGIEPGSLTLSIKPRGGVNIDMYQFWFLHYCKLAALLLIALFFWKKDNNYYYT